MAANMENKMFASKISNPTISNQELFEKAEIDFSVTLKNLSEWNEKFKDYNILINDRNGEALRMAKGRFQVMQTQTMQNKLSPLGEIESCGAIKNGEKVFWNMAAEKFSIGEGNTHNTHISIILPLDGTMKITFGISDTRIQCQNQLNL